jgi:hypothetical protein
MSRLPSGASRNRSQTVEGAPARLAQECAKLDPKQEKALAEEGLTGSWETWPEY